MSNSDVTNSIISNAQKPKKVTVGDTTTEQHSLKDQIEADRYQRSVNAVKKFPFGMVLGRFRAGGTD